jgi:hypothetical protein
MQAYRIHNTIIAADIPEEASAFYCEEIGGALPEVIEEVHYNREVCCPDGTVRTVMARIHQELDARNAWLMMGVPCELHFPFLVGTLI